ncbi:hypothetical protein [Flavisolibacter ginsenosidimutans]|uniref:Outer membrane protein beta-barrel domain-containing protein n=1 Tax=Flavisolibacter ginsenosidimutans TaxID=661481 RepID=A0A5B8UL21_9BACT|nr:hypothetical protein [Flavisolibacter ginsenosidimutans]QEC56730.1 hypothetical protein FSB75_12750 [Flavisolibacter ginsenosidimutans]
MKKGFLLLLTCVFASALFSQTYISLAPQFTNSAGTLSEKGNIALEVGRQWDVFSMGVDIGKTTMANVHGRDTSVYLELRPNLNVFQQGRFTNTFTAGIGGIFNAKENFMTELTSGIEYAYSERIHFNVVFGQYFYSGKYSSSDVTFFGVSAMFYLKPSNPGSIIKKEKQ